MRNSTNPMEESLEAYLNDIDPTLLTRQQEFELAELIEKGGAEGERARNTLVQHNLRLVVSTAKKYRGRGVSMSDLVQEGNLGLMKAAEKFDRRVGTKFGTYASWWIKRFFREAIIKTGRTVYAPHNKIDSISAINAARGRLEQQTGRPVTDLELAQALGMEIEKLWNVIRITSPTVAIEQTASFDEEGSAKSLLEMLSNNDDDPADMTEMPLREALMSVLSTLDPREREVIVLRFGLGDDEPMTLKEVGELFGISRERVRQIERDALLKLREPTLTQQLEEHA